MTADDTVTAKLAEWGALVEGLTPGEWTAEKESDPSYPDATEFWWVAADTMPLGTRADAEFIAASRQMVPALLAAVKDVLRVCDERRGDCGDDYADGWTAGWADALLEVRRAVTKRIGGEG